MISITTKLVSKLNPFIFRRHFGDARAFVRAEQVGNTVKQFLKPKLIITPTQKRILTKLRDQDREMDLMRIQLADIQNSLIRINNLLERR